MKYEINKYTNSMGVETYEKISDDEAMKIIASVAEREKITIEEIVKNLENFKTLKYEQQSNYYYTHAWKTIRTIQRPVVAPAQMTKCACGHTVPTSQVMSASLGSSCERCYDRMSD